MKNRQESLTVKLNCSMPPQGVQPGIKYVSGGVSGEGMNGNEQSDRPLSARAMKCIVSLETGCAFSHKLILVKRKESMHVFSSKLEC